MWTPIRPAHHLQGLQPFHVDGLEFRWHSGPAFVTELTGGTLGVAAGAEGGGVHFGVCHTHVEFSSTHLRISSSAFGSTHFCTIMA